MYKVCTPMNCSLLTGRLHVCIHVNDNTTAEANYYNPQNPVSGFQGIPWNMTMIAERLKSAGYATHQASGTRACMATPDHILKTNGARRTVLASQQHCTKPGCALTHVY